MRGHTVGHLVNMTFANQGRPKTFVSVIGLPKWLVRLKGATLLMTGYGLGLSLDPHFNLGFSLNQLLGTKLKSYIQDDQDIIDKRRAICDDCEFKMGLNCT